MFSRDLVVVENGTNRMSLSLSLPCDPQLNEAEELSDATRKRGHVTSTQHPAAISRSVDAKLKEGMPSFRTSEMVKCPTFVS
jgi:hypothetical protein